MKERAFRQLNVCAWLATVLLLQSHCNTRNACCLTLYFRLSLTLPTPRPLPQHTHTCTYINIHKGICPGTCRGFKALPAVQTDQALSSNPCHNLQWPPQRDGQKDPQRDGLMHASIQVYKYTLWLHTCAVKKIITLIAHPSFEVEVISCSLESRDWILLFPQKLKVNI